MRPPTTSRPAYIFESVALDRALKSRRKIALFLDFDGTLVPIRKDPSLCVLPAGTRRLLETLARSDRFKVAVLSGRALSDIREKICVRKIYYSGNHGLGISGPDIKYTHPGAAAARPVVLRLKKRLAEGIRGIEGAWVEDKGFSISLHFRSVEAEKIPAVKRAFHAAASGILKEKSFYALKGKKVLELAPDVSETKGTAALRLLGHFGGNPLPIFIGDDETDETAFRALSKHGITIRVGRSAKTAAKYYLRSHSEVPRLLDALSDSLKM